MSKFNHEVKPNTNWRHPDWTSLAFYECIPHYGAYIITSPAKPKHNILIQNANDLELFGGNEFTERGYGYSTDELLDILEPIEEIENECKTN